MGEMTAPSFPTVVHMPMAVPRTNVGNSSDVIIITATICSEMKNLPSK